LKSHCWTSSSRGCADLHAQTGDNRRRAVTRLTLAAAGARAGAHTGDMRKVDPHDVVDPPGRNRRERRLDRVEVAGALLILAGLLVVAIVALI
jgi:hypothetical protein